MSSDSPFTSLPIITGDSNSLQKTPNSEPGLIKLKRELLKLY